MNFVRTITLVDVIDVAVLAILIYQVLLIFHRTRASQLMMGIFYFVIIFIMAFLFKMNATLWVFEKLAGLLAISFVIIFQPELRRFFEQAGRRKLILGTHSASFREDIENLIETVVQSLEEMSEDYTGALIVLERNDILDEAINTGERIDADVRKDLIKALFHKGNPLHDGAVIIRDGRVISARSFLRLTESRDIPSHLGTRHRAALGITEKSDAISLVVSEETGHLSLFHAGKPAFRLTPNTMRHMVKEILLPDTGHESPYASFRAGIGRYFRFGTKRSRSDKGELAKQVAAASEKMGTGAEKEESGKEENPQ